MQGLVLRHYLLDFRGTLSLFPWPHHLLPYQYVVLREARVQAPILPLLLGLRQRDVLEEGLIRFAIECLLQDVPAPALASTWSTRDDDASAR